MILMQIKQLTETSNTLYSLRYSLALDEDRVNLGGHNLVWKVPRHNHGVYPVSVTVTTSSDTISANGEIQPYFHNVKLDCRPTSPIDCSQTTIRYS